MSEKMKVLGRDEIVAVDDGKRELVTVPEWGGAVWVRSLSGADRAQYTAAIIEIGLDGKPRAKMEAADLTLAYLSICDENGERLFTDRAGFDELGKKSSAALKRVTDVAERLSGLDVESRKRAAGNSDTESSDDSSSS